MGPEGAGDTLFSVCVCPVSIGFGTTYVWFLSWSKTIEGLGQWCWSGVKLSKVVSDHK